MATAAGGLGEFRAHRPRGATGDLADREFLEFLLLLLCLLRHLVRRGHLLHVAIVSFIVARHAPADGIGEVVA